jgi:hypothetical protein
MSISEEDGKILRYARDLLENPGLAARLTNVVGMPFEKAFAYLPARWGKTIQDITQKSLRYALETAVRTMNPEDRTPSSDRLHKFFVAASGGIGGAFGLPALAVELPVTTIIMFRSIADIARSEGEEIRSIAAKLACLEVFALGGESEKDNAVESGYYVVRTLLSKQIAEAAKYIAEKGIAERGAPALVRLIAAVSSRFGATVSQKAAASAVPIIGAAGGALINSIFMDHFQNMARGHFIVRRLEKKYGSEEVRRVYTLP